MKIGFVGVGKLGKDAATVMAKQHDVVGYDIADVEGVSFPMAETLEECVKGKDVVFIAVPTPHHSDYDGRFPTSHLPPRDFDYSIATTVTKKVDDSVDPGTIIVMISTMLPGTVRREIAPRVENGRFVYNPYLIAQGTVQYDMEHPEMIMIGTENGEPNEVSDKLMAFYKEMCFQTKPDVRIELGTWEEIESMKIFYNTFITAKLCLVNMIQDAAMKVGNMNVDVVTSALAASTDRIMGPKYMTAGLGDGGGCHPRDNIALRSFAQKHDFGYDLFDAIMKAREEQAHNMAKYFKQIDVPVTMPVVILGAGFKPGVNQFEGSPSILVGHYLKELGYEVSYDHEVRKKSMYPGEQPVSQPTAYLLGWKDYFTNYPFIPGSIVVDPWRSCPKREKVKVYHYGNSRQSNI